VNTKDIHHLLSMGTNDLSKMLHDMNKAERIARLLIDQSAAGDRMVLAMLAEELCGERISWRIHENNFTPLEIPDYAVFFWRCGNVVSLGRNNTMSNEFRIFMPSPRCGGSEMNIYADKFIYVRAASTTEILQIAETNGDEISELVQRGSIR
jgi:hypothetical protein